MKKLVIGMLAHVDAGKTTLSESILYTSGAIRKLGRVDNKDAFLDNNDYERQRGITIFSKQAVFTYNGCVLNAVRDRVNDYFRAMTPFVTGNHTPQTQNQQPAANGQPAQPQQQAQPTNTPAA